MLSVADVIIGDGRWTRGVGHWWNYSVGQIGAFKEKPVSVLPCPPNIPHGVLRNTVKPA